ncbi:hypothetical protein AOXY_G8658 [Acipenser oxyrinchus oxyrinchus]|uniref:Uncharacterized protein n=1 Tax=Acipenser oxyrinchus oxyrinchus TaxID=40147 RepID=A0AAD8G8N1_ACIOX|nr:hypothetical protein AOXY_G8658 [Acipenser oxyrinchus oxyrinchus]
MGSNQSTARPRKQEDRLRRMAWVADEKKTSLRKKLASNFSAFHLFCCTTKTRVKKFNPPQNDYDFPKGSSKTRPLKPILPEERLKESLALMKDPALVEILVSQKTVLKKTMDRLVIDHDGDTIDNETPLTAAQKLKIKCAEQKKTSFKLPAMRKKRNQVQPAPYQWDMENDKLDRTANQPLLVLYRRGLLSRIAMSNLFYKALQPDWQPPAVVVSKEEEPVDQNPSLEDTEAAGDFSDEQPDVTDTDSLSLVSCDSHDFEEPVDQNPSLEDTEAAGDFSDEQPDVTDTDSLSLVSCDSHDFV